MSDKITKDLPNAGDLKVDELLRTLVGQMFEADNDTTTLFATLETADGTPSELEFEIHITSINGIRTRTTEDDKPATQAPSSGGSAHGGG